MQKWSNKQVYSKGNKVLFAKKVYLAKKNTLGVCPALSSAWELLENVKEEISELNIFNKNITYKIKDCVLHNGLRYIANANTKGTIPGQSDIWLLQVDKFIPKEIPKPEIKTKIVEKTVYIEKKPVIVEKIIKEVSRPVLNEFWIE